MRECGLVCYQRLLLLLLLSASFAATQSTQVTSKPSGSEPTVSTPSDLLRTPPAPSPIRRAPHTGSRHKRLNASEPVLNCSKQLADAGLSKRSLRSLQDTFLEPVLHACFDAHPYNIHQLPFAVGTKREVLEVEYSFALSAILRLGNDGSMMARANFEFSWNDRLRRWNKSQIPLEYILIPGTELWYPNFVLTNCESMHCFIHPFNETMLDVETDGRVTYSVNERFEANCNLDLKYFPYDWQPCTLTFLVTDYSSKDMSIVKWNRTQHEHFHYDNEEWEFLFMSNDEFITGSRRSDTDDIGFTVELHMRRHSIFYVCTLVVPVAVISLIGLITLCLPIDSGDRINLAMNVLLGFLFLQSVIATLIPRTDTSPLLATYLVGGLVLSGLNLILIALIGQAYVAGESLGPFTRLLQRVIVVRVLFLVSLCTFSRCRLRGREPRSRKRSPGAAATGDAEMTDLKSSGERQPTPNAEGREPVAEEAVMLSPRAQLFREPKLNKAQDMLSGPVPSVEDEVDVTEDEIEESHTHEVHMGAVFRGPNAKLSEASCGSNNYLKQRKSDQKEDDATVAPKEAAAGKSGQSSSTKQDEPKEEETKSALKDEGTGEGEDVEIWRRFATLLDHCLCLGYIVAQLLLAVYYLVPIWYGEHDHSDDNGAMSS